MKINNKDNELTYIRERGLKSENAYRVLCEMEGKKYVRLRGIHKNSPYYKQYIRNIEDVFGVIKSNKIINLIEKWIEEKDSMVDFIVKEDNGETKFVECKYDKSVPKVRQIAFLINAFGNGFRTEYFTLKEKEGELFFCSENIKEIRDNFIKSIKKNKEGTFLVSWMINNVFSKKRMRDLNGEDIKVYKKTKASLICPNNILISIIIKSINRKLK